MKDSLQLVKDLLSGRNWDAVILATDHLLADNELTLEQKAFCYYAKCRALSNLDRYGAALEPGQRAVYLSREAEDFDLLGRSLVEVAWVQQMMGMYQEMNSTLLTFLANMQKFSDDVKQQEADVLVNLGVSYRALGEGHSALDYFTKAWNQLKGDGNKIPPANSRKIEKARSLAVWAAMDLGLLQAAKPLLAAGDEHVRAHPNDVEGRAHHLIDLAKFAMLSGDSSGATRYAREALNLKEKVPQSEAPARLILYDVAIEDNQIGPALTSGYRGLQAAERAELHDLVSEFQERLRRLYLQHPEQVLDLVGTWFSSANV